MKSIQTRNKLKLFSELLVDIQYIKPLGQKVFSDDKTDADIVEFKDVLKSVMISSKCLLEYMKEDVNIDQECQYQASEEEEDEF